jgi:hypothetical protein
VLRIYLVIAAVIAVIMGGGGIAYKYQHAKLRASTADLKSCVEVNAETNATIQSMRAERESAERSCSARLKAKDRLFARLQEIDSLSSQPTDSHNNGGPNAKPDAKTVAKRPDSVSMHGDTLLGALNGMYPAHGDADSVCSTGGPGDPGATPVLSGAVLYCFCSDRDVKNLLKNQALRSAHEADVENIIINLQEATK